MNLADQLRATISTTHTAIEQTPLAVEMIRGSISRDCYAAWLEQMRVVHSAVEPLMATCPHLASTYHPADMSRTDAIQRDQAWFPVEGTAQPSAATAELCRLVSTWAETAPWKLLGALYVLEGSRMGSMVLARSLAAGFRIPPAPNRGLDYHLDGITTRPAKWQQFRGTLCSLTLSDVEQSDVITGARETMDGLFAIYSGVEVTSASTEAAEFSFSTGRPDGDVSRFSPAASAAMPVS